MRKISATIYPYSKREVQFFRYASLLQEVQPVFAVSPPGWGLCGHDVTDIDGGHPTGIKITDDLEHSLQNSELLIITSFENYDGEEGGLKDTLNTAILSKKLLMLLYPAETEEEKELLMQATQLGLLLWKAEQHNEKIISYAELANNCEELKTPVSMIVGQGPCIGKFETQLGMRQELLNRGQKISQVGSRPYCELFGFHSFPSFMFSKELNETQKIIGFNYFIKQIEKEEEPDLLLIGVPGGIMPIIEKIHNNFGMLHLEVSAALEPDTIVYNMYSNSYSTKYYEKASELIYNRLNCVQTCCFIVSNSWIDFAAYSENEEFKVITYRKMYDKITEKPKDAIAISILEPDAFKKATDAVASVLEEYGSFNYY
jgi:peptide maturation system protein (TIGR04066 family)